MIRPFTCICMLLAAGSGLYLYQTKHRAQMLDRTIAQTLKQIDQTKDRIGVLKGEWALLNEPERLQDLAQQHLTLKTLAPTQFVALADLGAHLPAPLPPGTVSMPADDAPETAGPPAPVSIPVANAKPATTTAPPARAFAANEKTPDKTPDHSAEKVVDKLGEKMGEKMGEKTGTPVLAASRPATRPATVVASALPAPRPMPPPIPLTQAPVPHIMAPVMNVSAQEISHPLAPGTVGEAVARANRNRAGPSMIMPANTTSEQAYAPAATAQSAYGTAPFGASGSALGGAGRVALPAPVPYGASQARP